MIYQIAIGIREVVSWVQCGLLEDLFLNDLSFSRLSYTFCYYNFARKIIFFGRIWTIFLLHNLFCIVLWKVSANMQEYETLRQWVGLSVIFFLIFVGNLHFYAETRNPASRGVPVCHIFPTIYRKSLLLCGNKKHCVNGWACRHIFPNICRKSPLLWWKQETLRQGVGLSVKFSLIFVEISTVMRKQETLRQGMGLTVIFSLIFVGNLHFYAETRNTASRGGPVCHIFQLLFIVFS